MAARSLSARLAGTVLVASLLLGIGAGLLRLWADRQEAQATIDRSLGQVQEAHLASLTESAWVVDRERLALELGAVVHLPFIEAAEVTGPGLAAVRVRRPEPASARSWHRDYALQRAFEGTTEALGTLRVTVGLDPLDRVLRERLYRGFLLGAAETLCVSALLLLIVRSMVTRRVEWMAEALAVPIGGPAEGLLPVRSAERPDELDRLALAFRSSESRRREEVETQRACTELSRRLLETQAGTHPEVAQLVLEAALGLSGSEHGYVAQVDADRRVMIGHTLTAMMGRFCAVGEGDRRIEFPSRPDGRFPSLWGHSLNSGDAFYTNEPWTHPSWAGSFPSGHLPLRSFLSVPVLLDGRPVGQLALANRPGGYGERDLRAVEQIAGLYGIALQRLRAEEKHRGLEAQLRQAQKLEAIGTLAGGIAHDFNNILGGILGYAELTALRLPADGKERRNMEAIAELGERARDLVQQILAFSRRREPCRIRVDLRPVVEETLRMLRSSLPTTIEIRQRFGADAGFALADPTQVQQVVMNLCTNAFHAMRERGGILDVRLEAVQVDAALAESVRGLEPGPVVALTVSDTGSGISPDLVDRIFEPFFTTKAPGEGTGLGLAVVHGIVVAHHGAVAVRTRPGEGSAFTVYLPRVDVSAPEEGGAASALPRGRGRVLFVDDEPALAEVGREMLRRLGYEAVVATSGREALEAFRVRPDAFAAAVTDHTMPGMTGVELIAELLADRPDLPVILTTGYAAGLDEARAMALGARALLSKPVTLAGLGRALGRATAPPGAELA